MSSFLYTSSRRSTLWSQRRWWQPLKPLWYHRTRDYAPRWTRIFIEQESLRGCDQRIAAGETQLLAIVIKLSILIQRRRLRISLRGYPSYPYMHQVKCRFPLRIGSSFSGVFALIGGRDQVIWCLEGISIHLGWLYRKKYLSVFI